MTLTPKIRFTTCAAALLALSLAGAARQPANAQVQPTSVLQLAAGEAHVCALLANGTVHCWGRNDSGQLGDGTLSDRPSPAQVLGFPAGTEVIAIDANANNSCALTTARAVYCWGSNSNGQLGVSPGSLGTSGSANLINGLPASIAQISVGGAHVCAISTDSAIYCWGANNAAQLGVDTPGDTVAAPTIATRFGGATPTNVHIAVAAGRAHTCAQTSNGQVTCIGDNAFAQMGTGTAQGVVVYGGFVYTNNPFEPLAGAKQIATKVDHTCAAATALTIDGLANGYCWGRNDNSQSGQPAQQAIVSFANLLPLPSSNFIRTVSDLATGLSHTCALIDSIPHCWGNTAYGKVGGVVQSAIVDVPVPVTIIPTAGSAPRAVLDFALGHDFTCVRTRSTNVSNAPIVAFCWGRNINGQIGKPISQVETVPNPIVFSVQQATVTPTPGATATATRLPVTATSTLAPTPRPPARCFLPIAYAELGTEKEDNDLADSANALPINKVLSGRFDDTYDVFKTTILSGTLSVTLSDVEPAYAGNVQMLIYKGIPDDTTRLGVVASAPFVLTVSEPGEYYVVVYSAAPQSSQTYRIIARQP